MVIQAPALAAAPGSPDRIGIQLLEAPASAVDDPRAKIYIVDQLKPGSTITRRIRVSNLADHEASISLYAAAASVGDGEFRFGEGRNGNDLTSWTSVTPGEATLSPQSSTEATVEIAVPKRTTAGERYAVVWAEVSSQGGGGITTVNRVGIRIYLDVAGRPSPTAFEITGMTASRNEAGEPIVVANVENTGKRAVDISGTVQLTEGPGGLTADPAQTDVATIEPGGSGHVTAAFDPRLPAGPWTATVKLASGQVEQQASATMTFPDATEPAEKEEPAADPSESWWQWGLAGFALLLLVAGLLVALARRSSRGARRA